MVATRSRPVRGDPLESLNRRTKRLDGYSYKLAGGNQYGLDVAFMDALDLDESRMSIWIPYADGNARDGVGDLLEVGGIVTDRHRRNPIHLFDHGKTVALPIGLVEDPDTKEYTAVIDLMTKTARDNVFFYQGKGMPGIDKRDEFDHAIFCEQLYHMLCKRLIRAGSIGYQALQARQLQADYEHGTPQGLHLLQVLKLESSSVVLPANGDTVRKMLCMPTVCGKRLSPYLVKSLAPYDPGRKAQLGYEGKAMSDSILQVLGSHAKRELSLAEIAAQLSQPATDVLPVLRQLKQSGRVHAGYSGGQITYVLSGARSVKCMHCEAVRDIRKKYRSVKGVRRRVKRSSPGSSLIHVHGKDMDAVRQAAESKSVKFEHAGPSGKMQKVRLTGDDGAIDGIAQQYGQRVKSMETKSIPWKKEARFFQGVREDRYTYLDFEIALETREPEQWVLQRNKRPLAHGSLTDCQQAADKFIPKPTGAKSMQYGTKSAPAEGDGAALPDDGGPHGAAGGDEGDNLEPYGAQVLRRIHEDHSILMEEYDEMIQVLEQEDVKSHLQDILEHLEEVLSDTEAQFSKAYADLPAIDGAGEKDADGAATESTDATEATSEEEDVPSEDEAVQGMRKKYIKALRGLYKRKSLKGLPIEDGHEPGKEAAHEQGRKSRQLGVEGEHEPGKEGVRQEGNSNPAVSVQSREKLDTAAAMSKSEQLGVGGEHEPGREAMHEEAGGNPVIDPRHRETLDTAAGFVKDLSQTQDLTDQHRFDAYHYHKLLDPIGDELTAKFKSQFPEADAQDGAVNVTEPTGQRDVRDGDAAMAKGFGELEGQDDAVNVTAGKGWHVAIKGVAGFLHDVATSGGGSGTHMQKAAMYGKMLDDVIQQGFPQVEAQDGAAGVQSPSSDVSVKALRSAFAKQSEEMQALQKKLESIKIL